MFRPIGEVFIDDSGLEMEVFASEGTGCINCYYRKVKIGEYCSRTTSVTGNCAYIAFNKPVSTIFKKHIRKTVKLDLTE